MAIFSPMESARFATGVGMKATSVRGPSLPLSMASNKHAQHDPQKTSFTNRHGLY